MCEVCLNKTYSGCPVCSDDKIPYVHATIVLVNNENQLEFDYQLEFDCPNCTNSNEIHICDDPDIAEMKLNNEYDYKCQYCKIDLELLLK